MNKIKELIEQLCPEGVVFKELGELGYLYGGLTGKSKIDFQDGNAKFVTYMNIFSNISVKTDIDIFVNIGENENQNKVEYGDVLFTGSSETPNECGMSSVLTEKITEPLYLNSFSFGFRLHDKELFLPVFLKYLFRDDSIRKQIGQTASGVTRFNISKKRFAKVIIPIPPIAVQQEIAHILDSFTQLQAELEAELEVRRTQYEYYKNELLNFEESDKWTELKEIVDFSQGIQVDISKQSPVKKDGFVRFLRIVDFVKDNEPPRYIKNPGSRYVKNDGDLVMIRYGASAAGKVFLIYNGAIANNMFQIKLITKELDIKFLYYYLSQTKIYNFLNSNGGSSTMPAITFGQIGAVKIPIPSLAEQERIVGILDKFEALVNDISVGIPAEIKARRKQYEYYRGKLLSFNPLTTNH